jgi:hypothetical protein
MVELVGVMAAAAVAVAAVTGQTELLILAVTAESVEFLL